MSSSSGPAAPPAASTEHDEEVARSLALIEEQNAVSAANNDGYDNLSKEELLRELRTRDTELVAAVGEVQLLRANISKAEELGRNGLIFHPPNAILYRQAFALSANSRLTPVDIYHDADSNLCILGRADFTGDLIIHQHTGDGPVKERKERVVAGMVMWPIELDDGKGKGKA